MTRRVWRVAVPLAIGAAVLSCRPRTRPPFAIADSLRLEGRAAQSIDRYRALRDSLSHTADTGSWWRAQFYYAHALVELGRSDSARTALAQALALAGADASREARTRLELGHLLDQGGQFAAALAEVERAGALVRQARDRPLEGNVYTVLGEIYSLMGRHREALAAHDSELVIGRETGAPRAVGNALNEVGIDYRHLGRYSDAAAAYQAAIPIFRRLGDPLHVAITLLNYANLRAILGDDDQAFALTAESMALADSLKNPRGQAITRNNLAEIYARAGEWSAARPLYLEALAIDQAASLRYGIVIVLENLGRAALAEGRPAAAIDTLRRALALADSGHYGTQRAFVRAGLARAYAARGAGRTALRWADAAVRLADSLADPEAQYEALAATSAAARAARLSSAAIAAPALQAIGLLESVRGRMTLGDLRMGVVAPRSEVYEAAIRAMIESRHPAEAFAVAERARARLLLELMSEREAARTLRSRADTVRAALRERFEDLASAPPARRPAVDSAITRLLRDFAAVEDSARRLTPDGSLRYPAPATLAEVRTLIGPGQALLSFFWGDSAVYGWWLGPRGLRAARLGAADSLASLVQFLRSAIQAPGGALPWRQAAQRAYQAFVAPLALAAPARMYVVPDGALAYLPFEVLIPDSLAAPWAATRQLVYGPSAGVLLALANAPRRPHWTRAVLAVGNPTSETASSTSASARAAQLAALPYAEQEAAAVTRLFRDGGADVLVGARATLARWLSLDPSRYRYLHFAAHATIDDRRPDRTSVALAGEPLDLAAIHRLRLGADLVTLSGCETALGRRVRGEGLVGLPHAFLAAGARGAVVTLWRVGDRPAADFMVDFYRQLQQGRAPAAALSDVRRAWLARQGAASHPSQWAPFVLVGGVEP